MLPPCSNHLTIYRIIGLIHKKSPSRTHQTRNLHNTCSLSICCRFKYIWDGLYELELNPLWLAGRLFKCFLHWYLFGWRTCLDFLGWWFWCWKVYFGSFLSTFSWFGSRHSLGMFSPFFRSKIAKKSLMTQKKLKYASPYILTGSFSSAR